MPFFQLFAALKHPILHHLLNTFLFEVPRSKLNDASSGKPGSTSLAPHNESFPPLCSQAHCICFNYGDYTTLYYNYLFTGASHPLVWKPQREGLTLIHILVTLLPKEGSTSANAWVNTCKPAEWIHHPVNQVFIQRAPELTEWLVNCCNIKVADANPWRQNRSVSMRRCL